LEIIAEIPAGTASSPPIRPLTCIRIMTGGMVPSGADAIVPVERTRIDTSGRVILAGDVRPGDHIRRAGSDLRAGEVALEPGRIITPASIAVLASLGHAKVEVAREPRVVVLTTGNELVDAAESPGPGQIRDSNGPSLAAQVVVAGGKVLSVLRAGDDRQVIRKYLESALEADLIVVSGGVSVGEYDFVKDELVAIGMDLGFWKVRQKPGKPLAFGTLAGTLVFGLPGNPVSSAVCFYEYVRPALARMLGRDECIAPLIPAVLKSGISKKAGVHHFVRGYAEWNAGELVVDASGPQGSHVASTLARANCLIHIAEGLEDVAAGSLVDLEWLAW
ncbi:MAG: gephyrin-like molybdotransferase Glp, partial [Rhodothermales bacterium]